MFIYTTLHTQFQKKAQYELNRNEFGHKRVIS